MAEAVERLTREYLDVVFAMFPTEATALGRHEHDRRLEDLTAAGLDGFARRLAELRRRVAAVDPVDEEEAVDRDALAAGIADGLFVAEVERPWRRNPFEAATAVPASLLLLVARDFAPLEERLASAAERLEQAPRFLAQARELLDQPCPALWRQMAVAAARGGAGFLSGTLGPLAAGTPEAERVAAAAAGAGAALHDFAGWLEGEHADRFPDDAPFAIGEAAQARKLREVHCFDTSPAGFVEVGEAQIQEITAAMAEHAGKLGADDWSAKLDQLKAHHPDVEGLLPAYRRELDRLEAFVFEHDLATDPRATARIEPTPEFLRPVMGYAAYLPAGPFDPWQQGYFWVTPPPDEDGLRDHFFAMIPAVAAHEGYPGHHLQLTSVNRLESVTRRAIRSPVMVEGWGLYTEQLMADVGYYDDEARLAQLLMRLLRALRIVLDMQLQSGELSYEAAVARAVSVGRVSESTARSEVARYSMTPTQPFSYLIGCLELERLRAASQARLGDTFRLRRFHDRVLSYGNIPPTLVARAIAAADEAEQRHPPEKPPPPRPGGRGRPWHGLVPEPREPPMSLQAVHLPQPLLIVPPLLPPLVLRTETGFFGAKRFGPGEFDRCRPCTRFEAPPSPPPPPPVRYLRRQVHEGVDLEGEAGDCVFAAYMGRVVEVEVGAGGTRGNVTIDHHPFGTGLVSSYLHLEGGSLCVEEGEVVTKGQVIGRIGSGPEDPHLHFALRIVIDPSDSRYWADGSSVALDPTRLLYRLEADDLPVLPAGGAATVSSIGVELVANVPLFRAYTDASPDPYGIPLYEPSTEHERGLAAIFGRALELGRPVEVEYRDSVFFGPHRIPASVRLA